MSYCQTLPNKARTGRWGASRARFSSISRTRGFEFILLPRRVHARPSATIPQRACGTYANRWTFSSTTLQNSNFIHIYFPIEILIQNYKTL